ncbi:MAG: aldo/keto reductase [Promethearchaeota archaeon]|nr:MAG: aldo/keto reductase [Candidatus Lokiarchaeota archaeon]
MKYRKMGSLNWDVSVLGFGAMRFPMIDQTTVNEEEAIKMIRYAIDNGVNYIDTAYPYHNGESEVIVGKALKEGYREKVYLTTKLPMWAVKNSEDFDKFLSEQIDRLQSNPDIYLFHGLTKNRLEKIKKLNLIEKMEDAKERGSFKYIGFSFHDNFEVFKEIIDYYKWDCCQIQFNYLDVEYQAGTKGVEYAGSKNIALIIMEPIRGGKLAITEDKLDTKPELRIILDNSKTKRTLADWALQFVWNYPEVCVVLSGMSNMQQVKENIESANNSAINSITKDELKTISKLRKTYDKYDLVPCTSCRYCLPCPNGVSITWIFRLLNELGYWGEERKDRLLFFYDRMAKTPEELEKRLLEEEEVEGAASLCIQCGECLEKCPQQIDIPDMMERVNGIFKEGKDVSELF